MPFFEKNDLRTHYRIDGPATGPVLVLINSIATDLSVWDALVAESGQRMRVLRYDLRGQGQSDAPDGEYSMAQLADDLLALLDGLDLRRVHVCGLSLGAMIAMQLATTHPARVDKLVLCNTTAYVGQPDAWNARMAAARQHGVQILRPAVLGAWLSAAFTASAPQTSSAIADMVTRSPAAGFIGACAAIRDMDQRKSIAGISAPTLVVSGTADTATPPTEGKFIAAVINGARYVELPGGHLSNVEQPSALAGAILSFLQD